MKNDVFYTNIILVFIPLLCGVGFIYLAYIRKKAIERTLESIYKSVPMEVLEVGIFPNYLYGETVAGPLEERTSMILTRYRYIWNGKVYESCMVFPLEIEWIKPRISLFSLFEDLKAKRLNRCFVDSLNPSRAVLFRGWSPYLKQNIIGIFASGILFLFICALLVYFLFL